MPAACHPGFESKSLAAVSAASKNKSRAVIFVMGKVLERMVERTWKSQGNPPNGSE